ncbi:MAG: PAS domain S-box protein, partial [Humidesulfovibrio sp.]|nr:PAS domain S-box protein [Humidesulfovibrio sp.]
RNEITGWTLVMETDEAEILAPATKLATVSVGVSLLTLALVALALGFLRRTLIKLRESEAYQRTLTELSPVGVISLNEQGQPVYMNAQARSILSIESEAPLPESICLENEQGNALDAETSPFSSALLQHQPILGSLAWFRSPSGERKALNINVSPLSQESSGNAHALVATMEDITQMRQAEEALRESEERYRSVIQNMQDVYYRTDAAGRVTMMSPSGLRLYGCESLDEVRGMPSEAFYMNPAERQVLLTKIQAEGVAYDFELTLRRKDGTPALTATTSSFYYDAAGNVLGVEGILRDITERKQAEQELANAKAILEAAFEQNPAPMVLVTMPDGIIRIVNQASREFLGIEDEPSYLGLPLGEAHWSWQDYTPDGRPVPKAEIPLVRAMAGETT